MEWLLKNAVKLIGTLPVSLRARAGRVLGSVFSIAPTRDRKIAQLQMNTFLGSSTSSDLAGVYASIGETLFETFNLTPLLNNYQNHVQADWAQLDEVRSRGKPIIILSAHTGNWELLAACSVKRGYVVSVVGREARNAGLQKILRQIRSDYGVNTIWKSGRPAVDQIILALKAKQSVAALIENGFFAVDIPKLSPL